MKQFYVVQAYSDGPFLGLDNRWSAEDIGDAKVWRRRSAAERTAGADWLRRIALEANGTVDPRVRTCGLAPIDEVIWNEWAPTEVRR